MIDFVEPVAGVSDADFEVALASLDFHGKKSP